MTEATAEQAKSEEQKNVIQHTFRTDTGYIISKLIDEAHNCFWFAISMLLLIAYVQGICLASGFWGTFGTIIWPPYAWLRSAEYTVNEYYARKGPCINEQHS